MPKYSFFCSRKKMPPKGKYGNRNNQKQDLQVKVKEITQRQQNWFKQRDTAMKSETDSKPQEKSGVSFAETHSPTQSHSDSSKGDQGSRGSRGSHGDQEGSRGSRSQVTGEKKAGSQGGFKAWTKARDDTESKRELGKSYLVTLPAQSIDTDAPTLEKPLSSEQFDDVAERITNRVKQELNLSHYSAQAYSQPAPPTPVTHFDNSDDDDVTGPALLNSHVCPQCRQLMVEPRDPLLIIPCGHNVCRCCAAEDDLCPVCSCEISSTTANIMLKQIISDFKREHRKIRSSRSSSAAHSSLQTDTDYREELRSLMLRLEVMEAECDNIQDVRRVIQQDMGTEQKQIEGIERAEEGVRAEMDELTRKLETLSQHKEQFRDNIERLEERYNRESEKLNVVRETIRELNRGVEKIQLNCGLKS